MDINEHDPGLNERQMADKSGPAPIPATFSPERRRGDMPMRRFGKAEEWHSLLGLGGYHLLEITQDDANRVVNRYLEFGGEYLETAFAYGNGASEQKLGIALGGRRNEVFLATKVRVRSAAEAAESINTSLRNLRTDHVDLLFMHAVQQHGDLEEILGGEGALRAVEEARMAGKARFIGISAHGWPDTLIAALRAYPFDAVMHTFNYLERFTFPASETDLLPLARQKGVAVVGMKPLADGYLYRSPEHGFRYAFSLPLNTVVSGMNSMEMLEKDLSVVKNFQPMGADDLEALYRDAPELGRWVCRQCNKCLPAPNEVPIPTIFQLEGWVNRQMMPGKWVDPDLGDLAKKLSGWFGTAAEGRRRYRELGVNPAEFAACAEVESRCPYGLPIVEKLEVAHRLLSE